MKKITFLIFAVVLFAFSFKASAQCDYTLEMLDSWGDGWNGGTMDVLVNGGVVLDDVTLADGTSGTLTFQVNPGDDVTTIFGPGGTFPGEITYNIRDVLDNIVGSGDPVTDILTGTITAACPTCDVPDTSYAVVSNCPVDSNFTIDVTINGIGAAASVTISDDQGTGTQQVLAASVPTTINYGAYANSTSVIITVTNDDDGACFVNSSVLTFDTVCPPANDDFANAQALNCNDNVTGSTSAATLDEDDAPDGFGADMDAPNVWFSYTGSGTAEDITLDLCPSNYDTSLLIYTGTSGNLTLVSGNDDNGAICTSGTRSYLTFPSDGTTTYWIAVEGWNSTSTGDYDLTITCASACTAAQANQDCANAIGIPVDGSTTAVDNTCSTLNPIQPGCDSFQSIADVWYSFTAPISGEVDINRVLGTATAAHVAVYSGTCGALVDEWCLAGVDGVYSVSGLTGGNTYYLQVWNNGSEEGTMNISLSDPTLSISAEEANSFEYFPNPVQNKLSINAHSNIEKVEVYNLLGQEVMRMAPNTIESEMDMSSLQTGSYFVKVTINNTIQTIRIIKK
jgi:hypothetical protein